MKKVKQKPIKWCVYSLSNMTDDVTEGDCIWKKISTFNSREGAINYVKNNLHAEEFSSQVFVKYIQKEDHSVEEYLFKIEPCF